MNKEKRTLFNIDWTIPYQAIVRITPEEAAQVLEKHNQGNRYLRQGGSKYIARQIASNEWITDHPQPICFSENGTLLDGQHRLGGIVIANEAVWASVRFGVRADLGKYIDTGINRGLGDRVRFVSETNVNQKIASMVTVAWRWIRPGKPTPEEAIFTFHKMKKSYEAIAYAHRPKKHVGATTVAFVFAEYHHRHGMQALEMYQDLFKPVAESQQGQALKNFLICTWPEKKAPIRLAYPYIVSACIAHRDNKEIKVLRARSWDS
jgi:hypothetical protein